MCGKYILFSFNFRKTKKVRMAGLYLLSVIEED